MSALAEKLRQARTFDVEVDGFTFHVLRPTALEFAEKLSGDKFARGVMSFVVGWEGVSELTMLGKGAPHPLPFDADACAEWLSDYPERYNAISTAMMQRFEERVREIGDAEKNSVPG